MKRFKYSVWLVIVLTFSVMSCAKPPEAEKSAAKAAMDAAAAVSADKYAASDFSAAQRVWGDAEAQMNAKKYKEAKQGYVDAKAAFDKAAAGVEAGKKAVADEATAAVTGLEEVWKSLISEAKKVEKKLKEKKEAWDADAKAFAEGLTAAKGMIATDPAGAKAKAAEVKAIGDKWAATFKELAAAPAVPEKAAAPVKKGKK